MKARISFYLGMACAGLFFLTLGELYLRAFPSADLLPYLGDDYRERPCFTAGEDLPIRFRSFEAFAADNPEWWRRRRADSAAGREWLFLGNSFGFNLSGHIRKQGLFAPARAGTLDRREPLVVRLAQIEALLGSEYAPERIFLVLTPIDLLALGEQPLATQYVNRHGSLTFRPRIPPGPLGSLVAHSRLALAAWARSGQHRGNPAFRSRHLADGVDASLRADLACLFRGLGEVCRRHETCVTAIVIPMRQEVCRNTVFPVEDVVIPLLRQAGIAVVDPRTRFVSHPRPEQLYIPDGHLSRQGNQVVAEALRQDLHTEYTIQQHSD